MATLVVINGQATLNLDMDNKDLLRLMDDVRGRIEAGGGFWVRSVGDESTAPQAIWVPPGSIVQFRFERNTVPPEVT